jgi:hypothetical protein
MKSQHGPPMTLGNAKEFAGPLSPAHHHIGLPAAAFGTDLPLAPIGHGHLGAVSLGHLGGVGLNLMLTILAPNDQPDVCGS